VTDGLTERDRQGILSVLEGFPKIRRAVLFGSRAIGTFRGASDLDLAIEGDDLSLADLVAVRSRVGRLELPFEADLVIRAKITNSDVEKHIQQYGRLFYERKTTRLIEWTRYSVADLIGAKQLVIGDGYRAKNEELSSTGLPFARAGNIDDGFHFSDADHFPERNVSRIGNKVSQPGDVVFTSKGTVGRFAFVREDTPRFVYSPQLCFWRSLDPKKIHPRFLYYWMFGREFFLQFKGVAGQTDMAEYVSLGDQRQMHVTLPEPDEQRAIAAVLGSLDDKIELNRRMNETLEALAKSLFKSWFMPACRSLGVGRDATQSALPKGWREAVLSECCENIFSGGTPSTQNADYWGGDIPWLSSGETLSRFIIDTEKTITPLGVENSSTRPARAGSTVIARAGQGHTRSQTSFLTFDSYINQSVVVLFADKRISSDLFLFFDLARRYEQFRAMSDSQSSRGSLTTKLLAEMKVVVPPRDLISKFDAAVAPMTKKIITNRHESRTLAALRDALLPKLLSGELRLPAQMLRQAGVPAASGSMEARA